MRTSGDRIRVLHAENDDEFADLTQQYFEDTDGRIAVETTTTVSAALERLVTGEFDCIVSDYELPETDGIELLKRVRDAYPDIPFILFTARGSEDIASAAISAGVTDYLQKDPADRQYERLANKIETAVGQYRAEQELERKNDLFEKTQELATVGAWEWYPQREEGYYSAEVYKILETEPRHKTRPKREISEFVHPNDQAILQEAFEEAITAGESYDIEVRLVVAEDTTKWVRTSGDPQFRDGECVRIRGTIQDITETKATGQRLSAYIDNVSDVLAIVSGDGVFIDVSASAVDVLGYDPVALEGNSVFEHIHPDDKDRVSETFWNLVKSTGPGARRVQYRFKHADGDWRWLESVATDHTTTTLKGYVVTTRDISGRKQNEVKLERTRDLLRQTERLADVGGWELDSDTREVYWTDNMFSLLEVNEETMPTMEDALDLFQQQDRAVIADALEETLESGGSFDVEGRFRNRRDKIRWLRVRGTAHAEHGEIKRLRGAVQDITERRNREQLLREMHDIISDRDQSFNEQVHSLLELGKEELDTKYGTLSKIDGDEYRFQLVVADDDSIESGDVVPVSATNCEIAASTKETLVLGDVARDAPEETDRAGYTDWGISCYLGAPIFVDDEVYGTFCFHGTEPRAGQFSEWEETLVDLMSRWVSYELQRQQTKRQLEEKNDRLEQFASIVSHDLRNPLNVVQLQTSAAQQEYDGEHLDAVQTAARRMETMIEDLLTLTRDGDTIIDPEPVRLDDLVDNCWATVETPDSSVETDCSQAVNADKTRLKQLFENLFRNAVEHGGEDVTVTVGALEDGFYIEDDGVGISEADRPKIFDTSYSTSQEGTGLGMSIVQQTVDAHDWDINVTESDSGGARFEITGVTFAE